MTIPRERIAVTLQMLNSTQDSIKGASRLVKQYNDQAFEVAKIFSEEIKRAPADTKLLIVYVLHEIMLETKDRNFVMAFGDVSRSIFSDIAESIQDKSTLGRILKIFSVWEKEFLFKKEFIMKLASIIQQKINILNGLAPIDTTSNQEAQEKSNTPKTQNYSRAFMRDYNNVQENPLAKEYYERKLLENQCSKYEERIMEINAMLRNGDMNRNNPQIREKLRESLRFLRNSQEEFTQLLTSTSDYMCVLSKKLEDDTKEYIGTSLEKYENFEKIIQRRKQL